MKKIIGILPTYRFENTDSPYDDAYKFVPLYSIKVHEAGATPIGILLNDKELDMDILDKCDGFIIPGGNKVYEFLFDVINYCIEKNKPLLGICLGAQAIDIFSIIYDKTKNPSEFRKIFNELDKGDEDELLKLLDGESYKLHSRHFSRNNPIDSKHRIITKNDSHLYKIYGESKLVSSMHSFDFKEVGKEFEITATAEDDVCECIEFKNKDYFIVGVHFHPEVEDDNDIFNYFMDEVNKR